jgi:hypothetical protein
MAFGGDEWSLRPLETEAAEFGAFAAVVAQWREKRGAAAVARWADYAIRDFAGWHGRFSLARITGGEAPDLHFELFGTQVAEWIGRDLTGKALRQALPMPEAARLRFVDHFAAVVRGPAIGVRRVDLGFLGRDHVAGETVELPIGKTAFEPTHILSFARRVKA